MRRRWTCARWPRAGWSSPLLLAVLAGCGGGGDAQSPGPVQAALPAVGPRDACPVSGQRTVPRYGPILGPGPAYPSLTFLAGGVLEIRSPRSFGSRAWAGQKVLWVQRPGAPKGLVVTGRRLDGPAGEIRFDDGDVPATRRLVLPPPDAHGWTERPGYTRVQRGGCYAYVVRGAGGSSVVVFRAVRMAHWSESGDRVRGRSARTLERAIVEPRGGERNGLAAPDEADCRAPSRRERRRDPFGGSRSVFSCSITDATGTRRYDVQVLPNRCYVAALQRRPGEHSRGIQACAG